MQSYYQLLIEKRPEDINLPYVISASEEEVPFYEIPETGISTADPDITIANRSAGWTIVERQIPSFTLDKILEEHVHTEIHFLKIDVEGFERQVLEGLDLSRWRPWIILAEATIPNSTVLNYETWEPLILSANYQFVYFDGLNRYYTSAEHPELRESFSIPPNYFDHFIPFRLYSASQEIEAKTSQLQESQNKSSTLQNELETVKRESDDKTIRVQGLQEQYSALQHQNILANKEIEVKSSLLQEYQDLFSALKNEHQAVKKEIDALRSELNWTRKTLGDLKSEISIKRDELNGIRSELGKTQSELEAKRLEAATYHREYDNLYFSRSYRITAPMRAFFVFTQKLRGRFRTPINPSSKAVKIMGPEPDPDIEVDVLSEAEKHFLDLFQREIAKRQNDPAGGEK